MATIRRRTYGLRHVVEADRRQLAEIAALLDGGWPPPALDSVFALEEAASASSAAWPPTSAERSCSS